MANGSKKALLVAAVLGLAFSLVFVSCKKKGAAGEEEAAAGAKGGEKTLISMAADVGGLGDESFNDGCYDGLEKAVDEFGLETRVVESDQQTDYIPNLSGLAEDGSSIVFAVGFLMADAMVEVAEAVMGLREVERGSVVFKGRDVTALWTRQRMRMGFVSVPSDRHRYGLVLGMKVSENCVIGEHDRPPFARGVDLEVGAIEYIHSQVLKMRGREAAALFVFYVLYRTRFGFEIRAVGQNPEAARSQGISLSRNLLRALLFAGFLAGLAGYNQVIGLDHKLFENPSAGYGWNGISVALLASNHPIGVIFTSILWGALDAGGQHMARTVQTPNSIVEIIKGIILFLVVARYLYALVGNRIRRWRRSRADRADIAGAAEERL